MTAGPVLAEAAGFALLSALSPTALLVAAILLGSASPRRMILSFLFGAVLVTLVAGVALFVVLRAGGLNQPEERQARYALRVGLGALALGVSMLLVARKPRPPDPDQKPSLVMRLASRQGPASAFSVGVLVFIPGVTYLAAVQVIATTKADPAVVVLGLALVVAVDVMFAWLPLLFFVVAPDATTRWLTGINGWLHSYGRHVLVAATAIAGLALVADGAAGLAS